MNRKKILTTFAGRKNRMELLRRHVSSLLQAGTIDEWHVWDFTRTQTDRNYVTNNYGPVRYIRPDAGYQDIGAVARGGRWDGTFSAGADLHVLIRCKGSPLILEYVLGGWQNRYSVIRKLDEPDIASYARREEQVIYQAATPSLLCAQLRDQLNISLKEAGELIVSVPDFSFPALPVGEGVEGLEVALRGGFGSAVELFGEAVPVSRFVGDRGAQKPYRQAYQYYAARYETYRDSIFLKCDDDIVYVQEDGLAGFIDCLESHPELFILSANVINNGVCAYLQQQAGHLSESLGVFEAPKAGFGGSLWEDGHKANRLHRHFLQQGKPVFPLGKELVEVSGRISINFIGWRGENLRYMQVDEQDDEYMLSVVLPEFLGKKVAIFSDFMVSHLSFYTQESTVQPAEIIRLYEEG